MGKKKEEPEKAENHERWLLTYADLITLLMIFFVVMYSMSNVDAQKFQQLSNSLSTTFPSGTGVMQYNSPLPEVAANAYQDASGGEGGEIDNTQKSQIKELKATIDDIIDKNKLAGQVTSQISERGLVITLNEVMFFKSGEAEISKEAQQSLLKIGESFNTLPNFIRVEGNTDNVPMRSFKYASNWELSAARATTVLRLFIEKSGVDPKKLAAVGYGEYRPKASNATAEGRTQNRRVDIVILDIKYSSSESASQ